MTATGESESSVSDLYTFSSTASIRREQGDPSPPTSEQDSLAQQQTGVSDDEGESCDEVDEPEHRSRFNSIIDKPLCAEVLDTPPFAVECKAPSPPKYAVCKKRNEAVSGTGEMHAKVDDVLEQLQQLLRYRLKGKPLPKLRQSRPLGNG
ncbi:Hypothetical protein PHPALM_3176 [Phytophthora palmivora]|uniref:Uncharacterized protein n=1 Tax=Phytophthora palmivora TaxID=4796 RepID=A0A2P4YN41_9STRA|nr:Hypothetical protein PHPALM_3176 [Phytophthora palmivora]